MSFHLHSMDTPNGLKIRIMLAELNADYEFHPIDISNKVDQFTKEFMAFLFVFPSVEIASLNNNDEKNL